MAHYLLHISEDATGTDYRSVIMESPSAKEAVAGLDVDEGTIKVWTLRNAEPRTFEIRTESVRTITQT